MAQFTSPSVRPDYKDGASPYRGWPVCAAERGALRRTVVGHLQQRGSGRPHHLRSKLRVSAPSAIEEVRETNWTSLSVLSVKRNRGLKKCIRSFTHLCFN